MDSHSKFELQRKQEEESDKRQDIEKTESESHALTVSTLFIFSLQPLLVAFLEIGGSLECGKFRIALVFFGGITTVSNWRNIF